MNHGAAASGNVSTAVVIALAKTKGVDPLEVDVPLHDWLDPDALDAVVESMDRGHVAFEVESTRVRVEASGEISVDPVD